MFFRLNHLSFLETGKDNNIIYNLQNQRVYILDKDCSRFIEHCEANKAIEEIEDYSSMKESIDKFLKHLEEKELGSFYPNKLHIEKFLYNVPLYLRGFNTPKPIYDKVFLDIGAKCNLDCTFCNTDENITWLGCRSCINSKRNEDDYFEPDIQNLLEELRDYEVRQLIIRGGNPLLEYNKLENILKLAREITPQMKIIIVSSGTGLEHEKVLDLLRINSNTLANIVLFGNSAEDYQMLFGNSRILHQQTELIDKIKAKGFKYNITMLLNDNTLSERSDIIKFVKDKWDMLPIMAEVFDKKNGNQKPLSSIEDNTKMISSFKHFQEFHLRHQYNTCLIGSMEIAYNGEIHPCPMIKDTIGNLRDKPMGAILSNEKLYNYWEKTKSKVEFCKDCSMRHICADCSAFEVLTEKNYNAGKVYCPVDPANNNTIDKINFISDDFIEKICV